MPTSLAGLAVFVASLLPGFVYFCGKFTPEDGLSDQSECADCRGLNDALIEAQWVEALSEGAAWTGPVR